MRRTFRLPMILSNGMTRDAAGKYVAHSLDFDIVAVADSEPAALEKLRLAVKTYVEFGLSKGWDDYVLFTAPEDYRPGPGASATIMPPLEIASHFRSLLVVHNEALRPAS